jgi:hypothetical protein
MSGGITQLVAIGAQDAHLVGNPEVSFFRSTYKRHTNFSQTVERQVIQGNVSNNGTSTVRFERKGDLLGYVYLTISDGNQSLSLSDITSPSGPAWTDLISKVELLIGGQVIDDQDALFSSNIAVDVFAQNLTKSRNGVQTDRFYPLRFFFCENWQSAIPLISLQYHDVEIRITWGSYAATAYKDAGVPIRWDCYANFTYLDTDERTDFANRPQNMLIYQIQKSIAAQTKVQELTFNHPIKFLASSNINGSNSGLTKIGLFSADNKIKFQINGTDVSDFKFATPNFTSVATYYHVPNDDDNPGDLFVYPFCIDSAKLQPTGTLNFSRLDSARIISQTDNICDDIYACNYNILRIQNGMGGLMYAN